MKKKFFITTTIATTLSFFRGQVRLWQRCFDVCAISNQESDLLKFAAEEGVKSKLMPMHREIDIVSDFVCLFKFIWLFLYERPYVVHGNTPKAAMLSMLAAWITRRPIRIYMCHGLRYQSTYGIKRKLLMGFEKLTCICAKKVICVSNGVKEQLVFDGLCKREKAKVIRYGTAGGIDTWHFCRGANYSVVFRHNLNIPENAFVFIFIGRIVRDKGVDELVSAFNKLCTNHTNTFLLLIGGREQILDPVSATSIQIIETNKHIMELGVRSDIRPFLAISDALILPSHREGVGQVLLEAGCMDVPCIASNIIGCREVIIPGVNGELVPPCNEEELYGKMNEWVCNSNKVKLMTNTCRQAIVERYDQKEVWQAYLEEYKSYLFP